MARRRRAEKRKLNPDYRYNDLIVTQFINNVMKEGKRTLARQQVAAGGAGFFAGGISTK